MQLAKHIDWPPQLASSLMFASTRSLLAARSGSYDVSSNRQQQQQATNNILDNHLQDGVTLCTLGVGTTFGASVIPGKSHSVSVVTSDHCTLLRVRRADFQEIFNEQSHLINNVESSPFCSFTSLNRVGGGNSLSRRSLRSSSKSTNAQAANSKGSPEDCHLNELNNDDNNNNNGATREAQDEEELAELQLESLDANELSSHLMRIGWVLRTLILNRSPLMIQNRRIHPQHSHAHAASARHQAHAHHQQRQLVATASSSQLLAGASAQTKSAGRKMANYVANSFMRSSNKAPAPVAVARVSPSHALFTTSSFDASPAQAARGATLGAGASASPSSTVGESVVFRRCMVGSEMVDWLLQLSQTNTNAARFVGSRLQATSMWQVLLEQGIVFAFSPAESAASDGGVAAAAAGGPAQQFQFADHPQAYYKFWFDREGTRQPRASEAEEAGVQSIANEMIARPSESDVSVASESLWWSLRVLSKLAPDACFRLILSRRPDERSCEQIDIVYEELQHLKALSHLTNSVKKELAARVCSEHHPKQNTVLFNQGDVGQSWYIILRGSVSVVIVGKGVVCTLHEGDDFGKLALVNDAPRAATIVTNEPNCYFLRVDKHDFNTILKDVAANSVLLMEHGE